MESDQGDRRAGVARRERELALRQDGVGGPGPRAPLDLDRGHPGEVDRLARDVADAVAHEVGADVEEEDELLGMRFGLLFMGERLTTATIFVALIRLT